MWKLIFSLTQSTFRLTGEKLTGNGSERNDRATDSLPADCRAFTDGILQMPLSNGLVRS